MPKISDDQRKMFRQNQILLFAASFLQANRDEAAEGFGVLSGHHEFATVDGLLLEFPSPAELDAIVEELASEVRIEKDIAEG